VFPVFPASLSVVVVVGELLHSRLQARGLCSVVGCGRNYPSFLFSLVFSLLMGATLCAVLVLSIVFAVEVAVPRWTHKAVLPFNSCSQAASGLTLLQQLLAMLCRTAFPAHARYLFRLVVVQQLALTSSSTVDAVPWQAAQGLDRLAGTCGEGYGWYIGVWSTHEAVRTLVCVGR
jgi:hypothetical protein